MRLLVIGGTQFVGRAVVEAASARGHEVTIFHRGEHEPDGLPPVEHLHGDRHRDLALVSGRDWDAVLDAIAYLPGEVRALGEALAGRAAHVTLISTVAVHPADVPPGAAEDAPLVAALHDDAAPVTMATYGPLKVACEEVAAAQFPGRLLTIRPGYLVGPHDPTERFTWYLRRVAAGGTMLAPGPREAPFQVLDARDLGAFVVERIEAGDTGVYGVTGDGAPLGELLETAREVAGADTALEWAPPELVREQCGDEVGRWFPMWSPHQPGRHGYDARRAAAAGLRLRPLRETIADTLAWDRARGEPPLPVGLPPDRERALLAAGPR